MNLVDHPFIDICIPVHNAKSWLENTVNNVLEFTRNYRLIFTDDFSNAETKEYLSWLCHQHPTSICIRTHKQKWFTRSSNLCMRLARTEKFILLNSDVRIWGDWIGEMLAVWKEVESQGTKVGMVGSVHDQEGAPRYILSKEPDYVTGHCVMFSRESYNAILSTRDSFFNEKEEGQIHINSDRVICYDLNKIGYATVASYKTPLGHHGGKSWGFDLGKVGSLKMADLD